MWVFKHFNIYIPLKDQDVAIDLQEPLQVRVKVKDALNVDVDGRVNAKIPIDEQLNVPLTQTLTPRVYFDNLVPISTTIPVKETIQVNQNLPIINKEYNSELGWKFLFTMKQNEMFLFPSEDFNPKEVDLFDDKNLSLISKNLFRVQKIATKDYFFRHHLETNVEDNSALKGITWRREGLSGLKDIVKVRLNHLGKIVHTGEY